MPKETAPTTAFKGFNKDLTCRGYQFAEGGTFEHPGTVDICKSGFHAVLLPLDAITYYPPITSTYRQVILEDTVGNDDGDSKIAGRKITIGAAIGIPGLVRAHVEAVWTKATDAGTASKTSKATTGDFAHAATTGYFAHAATTGDSAHAATTGDSAHAATTGKFANAATTGYSANVRSEVKDTGSIAAVLGNGAAAGAVGCWLVLTDRDDEWNIREVRAVQVDGKQVKAGVFYRLENGRLVEVAR